MDALRRSLVVAPLAAWVTQTALAGDKKSPAAKRQGLRRDDIWMPKLSENLKDVVQGTVPKYTEVFIDEGDIDMLDAMRIYKEVGYEGPIVSDHTPRVEGDTPWGHIGRTFSHGYMRGLVHAVNAMT